MPILTLQRQERSRFMLPYLILVNEQPIGLMRTHEVHLEMPPGTFSIAVRLVFGVGRRQFSIGGERVVTLGAEPQQLRITDRERWWNLLFTLDLIVWLAALCLPLFGFDDFPPHPWNIVYHVLSDGFFALWLLRIWVIRKRYFVLQELPAK